MDLEFKGSVQIHAVEYAGFIRMNDEPYYEGIDLLDFEEVGEETARANAKLYEASYDLLQGALKLQEWHKKYPTGKIYNHSTSLVLERELTEIVNLQLQAIEKALK